MTAVEVYRLDDNADETSAVRALQEAKGLDNHDATQPFGLLFWHKRPFTVEFTSENEANRFNEQLRAFGYHGRLVHDKTV